MIVLHKKFICVVLAAVICVTFAGCRTRTTKAAPQTAETAEELVFEKEQPIPEEKMPPEPEPLPDTVSEPAAQAAAQPKQSNENGTAVKTRKATESGEETLKKKSDDDNSGGSGGKGTENQKGDIRDDNGGDDNQSNSQNLQEKNEEQKPTPTPVKIKEYSEMLSSNVAQTYECQKQTVYCETEESLIAASAISRENKLITNAGGINMAETFVGETRAGWLYDFNPEVIVKFVSPEILGAGVTDDSAARALAEEILSREGWEETYAVKNADILLLSSSLLESDAGRITATVAVGRVIQDALFDDLNIETVYAETSGQPFDGIYYYIYS